VRKITYVLFASLLVFSGLTLRAPSQATHQDAAKPAANAWRFAPTPYLEWNKDISPLLRAQRDRYWDGVTHREWPLTVKKEDRAVGGPDHGDNGTQPEIPDVPDRAMLTATFTKDRSVLSASERSIYTEVTMNVQQVFEDEAGAGSLAPHKDVTLPLVGGTVALKSGQILSDHVQPSDLSLQPGRSYLLVLQYHKEGDWYELKEDWDITDGVVRANTRWGQHLAKDGRSRLNGLAVENLGSVLSEGQYAHN
jgi:hypothetical protein